jgi:GAF domain-containing protein
MPQDIIDTLVSRDVKSIIALPLEADGKIIGFTGFDECRRERLWTIEEIEFLRRLSEILSGRLA